MWPGVGDHMGWMWGWWIVGLIVLGLLVWAVARGATAAPRQDESPETILKRRYAQGELTHEEYERRLNDLRR
jgi:putative membrane protein